MQRLLTFLGVQSPVASPEKIVAATGGCLAIYLVYLVSYYFTGLHGAMVIVPSMGAATVLLFAVPHGQLSTPWSLFAGNLLSAFAGVSAARLLGFSMISAAIAVGGAIALMHVFRCIHPPGGATALAAVIGGDSVISLHYWYLLTPTLLNCLVLFFVAFVFNNIFSWRRYPVSLMKYKTVSYHPDTVRIQPHHIHQAIARSDIVVDASDEQIKHIVDLADEIMRIEASSGFDFEIGAYYTNGKPGLQWSVREVIDALPNDNPVDFQVIYRTVDGAKKGITGSCSLQEFSEWASHKMLPVKSGNKEKS